MVEFSWGRLLEDFQNAFNQEEIAQVVKPFLLPILLIAVYFSESFRTKKIKQQTKQ